MERRELLMLAGGSASLAIAGCSGGSDDDGGSANGDEENGDDNGDENSTENGDENGMGNESDSENGMENGNENGGEDGGDMDAPLGGSFSAVSQGGFIAIDQEDESTARENGVAFPAAEDGDEPVRIEASVAADGSWEATTVDFPDVNVSGIKVAITTPENLSGQINPEEGLMTASGELLIVIAGDEETSVRISIDATTGTSGAMTGSADFSTEPATATLVENEFVVEDTSGNQLVDSFLGLPSPESGTNWFEMEVDIES